MKIALCLYGKFNNRFSDHSGRDGFNYIQKTIFANREVDVFIHTWDLELEQDITTLYRPYCKRSSFEVQKDFSKVMEAHGLNDADFNPPGAQSFRSIKNSLSFFYSRKKAIELKRAYEQEYKFEYDVVIACRFDLGQIDKYVGYHDYRVSEISLDCDADMNYIYSAMWSQLNGGYADMWFYSSSKNMDLLGTMYDRSLEYYKPKSAYLEHIESGLKDSNAENFFSNEFLKQSKSLNLLKIPRREAHNNHLIHKWFFIDSGLYPQSRFPKSLSPEFCVIAEFLPDQSDVKNYPLAAVWFTLTNSVPLPENVSVIPGSAADLPTRVGQALDYVLGQGFKSCVYLESRPVANFQYEYLQLKTAVSFTLPNPLSRWAKKGWDFVLLSQKPPAFSFRIPNAPNLAKNLVPVPKRIYLSDAIWKAETLLTLLRRNTKIHNKRVSTFSTLGLISGTSLTKDGKTSVFNRLMSTFVSKATRWLKRVKA